MKNFWIVSPNTASEFCFPHEKRDNFVPGGQGEGPQPLHRRSWEVNNNNNNNHNSNNNHRSGQQLATAISSLKHGWSAPLQQQWPWCFCQQLPNSNCFVSSLPTAIVLSAASLQQLFCQQLANSNFFGSSFPTPIVLSAASQQQSFCQQLPNSNCFVSSFPTAIVLSAASQQQLSACRQDC